MEIIGTLLTVLAAIPKIASLIESFAAAVTYWYVSNKKAANAAAIADAAALAAKAESHEDREKSLRAWRAALSMPRVSK